MTTSVNWGFSASGYSLNITSDVGADAVAPYDPYTDTFTYDSITYTKAVAAPRDSVRAERFQIPDTQTLMRELNPNPQTINGLIGNNTPGPLRSGWFSTPADLGIFRSTPVLNDVGQTIYICSSTLSGHAGLLPNGYNTALARVPMGSLEHGMVAEFQETTDKNKIDCGGLILRSIHLSLRDHAGNVLDMGGYNWNDQIIFGYADN